MGQSHPSTEMLPQHRRQAVAAILAKGFLRYRNMARRTVCSPAKESSTSGQNPLGSVAGSRPCVPAGSGGYDAREPEKGQQP